MKHPIPQAAWSQHIAVLGKTGSGKTFAIKSLVEVWLEDHRRVCIIDPTGAWWGLRSSRDGKTAGYPVLVLGGEHGDLPIPASGGAAVARLVVEQGANLIADTSNMGVHERTRWFVDFATTLFRLNREPLHLVIDEAHVFAPQGKVPDPDTGRMLHAANQLASGGRSRGIRLAMLTQRPAKLHKDSLTCADTLVAMRVVAPQDRKAIKDWIDGCGDAKQGRDVLDSLANLSRGEGWVWYPEGQHLQRCRFPDITTFDSSATPTGTNKSAKPKALAEIDMGEVSKALAEAVQEAEANDPKRLRARIAELERAGKAKPTPEAPSAEYLAKYSDSVRAEVRRGISMLLAPMVRSVSEVRDRIGSIESALASLKAFIDGPTRTDSLPSYVLAANSNYALVAEADQDQRRQPDRTPPVTLQRPVGTSASRILNSIRTWNEWGHVSPTRVQVAFVARYSPKSSGYEKQISNLRSDGLIDYPTDGRLCLTDAGKARSEANVGDTPLECCYAVLGRDSCAGRILNALVDGKRVTRAELAERSGYSDRSSGFEKQISTLRGLGLITYPGDGMVQIAEWIA